MGYLNRKKNILVIDDEEKICKIVKDILRDEGFNVQYSTSGTNGLLQAKKNSFDVVLLDIWLKDSDGVRILQLIRDHNPNLPVIMISGHANIELAVKTLKMGAIDFIEKPIKYNRLLSTVNQALEAVASRDSSEIKIPDTFDYKIIGQSEKFKEVLAQVEKAAPYNGRVLIRGENGVGKELIAREIHKRSKRAAGPFIEVNCAAIPEELIESELFGHVKGAFTGAVKDREGKFRLADKGTLFLDEIGDMSLMTQAKVLRVLEEQKFEKIGSGETIQVDVRVIAASNKDLKKMIKEGSFREDLFYRLNVIPIQMPPLRERKEDIPLLAEHFLEIFCRQNNIAPKSISKAAMQILIHHNWPGNVRELKNLVERLVIMIPEGTIDVQDLPADITGDQDSRSKVANGDLSLKKAREDFERKFIIQKLEQNNWNITRTAEQLKIERASLHRKIKALGINIAPDEKHN